MFTLNFWRELFERAVKTAAQTVLLTMGGDHIFNVITADWLTLAGAAAGGAVISALTSLASVGITGSGSASLTPAVPSVVVVPPEATVVAVEPTPPTS